MLTSSAEARKQAGLGETGRRGGSGIRTHEGLAPLTVFKTVTFVRSVIPPQRV